MRTALDTAKADAKTSKIAVVQSPSADTDNTKPAASAFAGTIKTGLYPLLLVMPICTFLVIGTFNDSEIRRRLYSSPTGYTAATLVLMMAAGVPFDGITSTNVALTFVSLLAYTLMAIACGFLLGSVGFSEMAVNAFANVFGLLCMFTSGMAFPIDMMPEPMIMIGKLLPGWWLCVSIDNVFGLGTAAATGVDYGSWASSVGLVALFAVAFICLGLALGRIRRTRPSFASPTTTQLAK